MTLKEYNAEVARICDKVSKLPSEERATALKVELAKLPQKYRESALSIVTTAIQSTAKKTNRVEAFKNWCQSNPLISILIILAIIVMAIGALCESIGKLETFYATTFNTSTNRINPTTVTNTATSANPPVSSNTNAVATSVSNNTNRP